jgi:hypothetical protein
MSNRRLDHEDVYEDIYEHLQTTPKQAKGINTFQRAQIRVTKTAATMTKIKRQSCSPRWNTKTNGKKCNKDTRQMTSDEMAKTNDQMKGH